MMEVAGCRLHREGANHSIYINPQAKKRTAIPRHREIDEYLAAKILKDLKIPLC